MIRMNFCPCNFSKRAVCNDGKGQAHCIYVKKHGKFFKFSTHSSISATIDDLANIRSTIHLIHVHVDKTGSCKNLNNNFETNHKSKFIGN